MINLINMHSLHTILQHVLPKETLEYSLPHIHKKNHRKPRAQIENLVRP